MKPVLLLACLGLLAVSLALILNTPPPKWEMIRVTEGERYVKSTGEQRFTLSVRRFSGENFIDSPGTTSGWPPARPHGAAIEWPFRPFLVKDVLADDGRVSPNHQILLILRVALGLRVNEQLLDRAKSSVGDLPRFVIVEMLADGWEPLTFDSAHYDRGDFVDVSESIYVFRKQVQ